jgi:thymidine kinase
MFSGKTTELFRRLRRHERAGRSVVLLKHSVDVRYNAVTSPGSAATEAVTHNNDRFTALAADALLPLVSMAHGMMSEAHVASLSSVRARIAAADVVGIDEGQFFPDLAPAADALAELGKTVVVAALDGDFRRDPFPQVSALLPKAESVDKISAVCRSCGADAPFSARTTAETSVVVVGGEDKYVAACRTCYGALQRATGAAQGGSAGGSSVM